jgi:hypothetical protein
VDETLREIDGSLHEVVHPALAAPGVIEDWEEPEGALSYSAAIGAARRDGVWRTNLFENASACATSRTYCDGDAELCFQMTMPAASTSD